MPRGELEPMAQADPVTPAVRLSPDQMAIAGATLFGGIQSAPPGYDDDPRTMPVINPSYSGDMRPLPPPRQPPADPPMQTLCVVCKHSWGEHWETYNADISGCAGVDGGACTCEVFAMPVRRSKG